MRKKFAIPVALGLSLLVANSAYAAITSSSSSITISTASSSSVTLPYSSWTTVGTYYPQTEASLSLNGTYISDTLVYGTTKAAKTVVLSTGGIQRTYKVTGEHYEVDSNGDIKDYDETTDYVTYKPSDWATLTAEKELEAQVQKFVSDTVNTIAEETKIDLTGYTEVTKKAVFELDANLLREVNKEIKKNLEGGDLMPVIYLHDSKEKLYVLQKKHTGESIVTEFALKDEKWKKDVKEASGKPLKELKVNE